MINPNLVLLDRYEAQKKTIEEQYKTIRERDKEISELKKQLVEAMKANEKWCDRWVKEKKELGVSGKK